MTTHTSTHGAAHPVKKVQKNFNNYASVECGAKILGANSEAKVQLSDKKNNIGRIKSGVYQQIHLFKTDHFSHIEGEHGFIHVKPV